MAEVLFDASLSVNSVDLSDQTTGIVLSVEYEDIDATAFGATLRSRISGLGDGSLSGGMHHTYAAGKSYATLQPLAGTTTSAVVKPNGTDPTSATNPQFTTTVAVNSFDYINANVGELHAMDFDWPLSSGITIATS